MSIKKNNKFVLLFVTLLVTMSLFLTGCGATSSDGDEASPTTEDATPTLDTSDADSTANQDQTTSTEPPKVGLVQLVTHPALDAEREGVLEALSTAGFVDGENILLDVQNAEGDIATLSTIVQKFVDDEVALIVTITTPAIQAAYNVTKDLEGPPIVFNAVTDPYAAGIATAPDDHPHWIIGTQALPPVAEAMALIPVVLPEVKSIGIIWTAAEKNSEVATNIAREVAAEMGLEFVEATITDSSEVQTAAESLVAQDIDAFFISTDSTVVAGLEALVKVATENQIPLFANDPASAKRGAVAALGLDYFQDGLDTGAMAAGILKGNLNPADMTIEKQRAGSLAINLEAAQAQGVTIPDSLVAQAAQVFGGEDTATDSSTASDNLTVGLIQMVSHPALDAGREGALQALADNGLIDGENLTVIIQNAEGDIATLTPIAQSFVDQNVDLIISISTPATLAAFNTVKDIGNPPIVFNTVVDPFAAGLATAPNNHPAWITGVPGFPPVEKALQTMLTVMPQAKTIGLIWNPSEKNSEVATALAQEVAADLGLVLLEANIADSSEIQTAAESLVAQGIDAFFISTDATVGAGLEALVKVANENEIPLFANDPNAATRGAVTAVGVDPYQDGYDSGVIAAQILNGEATPADFDIEDRGTTLLYINYDAAQAQGVTIPADLAAQAAQTIGNAPETTSVTPVEGQFTIGMMQIASHPALDAAHDGALDALADSGLIEGENLTVISQNAEGDIATLSTIAQSFVDDEVDLIISTSTPASQAAFKAVQDLESPYVVFNVVTDPFAAGLATAPDDHPAWIVGTQALPPVSDAMQTMMKILPTAKTIGIIWNPAEKNSEVATVIVRHVTTGMGLTLLEANISDSSEIQTAAESLVAQGVDAFFISTDSTVVSGFEALVKVANENQIPLFGNDPASAERGAVAAIGLDYYQDGYDSGLIAAQLLTTQTTPADFTIEKQSASILHLNYDAAQAQGISFSAEIEAQAAKTFGDK